MSDHSVAHAMFSLERTYQAAPARVFAAWAEPAAKAKWFAGPDSDHRLDFRVGGHEVARGANSDDDLLTFESIYHDIVPSARIVYSSTLSVRGKVATGPPHCDGHWASDSDGARITEFPSCYGDGCPESLLIQRRKASSTWNATVDTPRPG
jgi:uncharacterized protein YndB with AHSA1/START domain